MTLVLIIVLYIASIVAIAYGGMFIARALHRTTGLRLLGAKAIGLEVMAVVMATLHGLFLPGTFLHSLLYYALASAAAIAVISAHEKSRDPS